MKNLVSKSESERGGGRVTRGPRARVNLSQKGKRGVVAPFYVEQEAPIPPGGLPQPGKLVVALPDNHLQYAVIWYGLAAVLVAVVGVWTFTSGGRTAQAKPPQTDH
jgi:cytochrome oxidase assembly protein ShyY1